MRKHPNPCWNDGKDCEMRYVGCKANCEKWHEWLAEHEARREELHRKRRAEISAEQTLIEGTIRRKRGIR